MPPERVTISEVGLPRRVPERVRADRDRHRRGRGHDPARGRRAARGDPLPPRRTPGPRRPCGDGLGRVLSPIEAGAITYAHKSVCRGFSVTGAALGSVRLFDALAGRETIVFKPAAVTDARATLAGVGPLAAINGAVEIDLTGRVNAESAGGRRIGAVGGQVDFLCAAAQGGGKPILALPARRIVSRLSGPGSTTRSDVDWVVTEPGARSLTGLADAARTTALLELAGDRRAEELAPTPARRLTA